MGPRQAGKDSACTGWLPTVMDHPASDTSRGRRGFERPSCGWGREENTGFSGGGGNQEGVEKVGLGEGALLHKLLEAQLPYLKIRK